MMAERTTNTSTNQQELAELVNGQLHEILCHRQHGINATYARNPENLLLVPGKVGILKFNESISVCIIYLNCTILFLYIRYMLTLSLTAVFVSVDSLG